MFLFILFLGAFFLPKTDSLQCYECSLDAYGKCNDKIAECPSQKSQCLASRVVAYYGENEIPQMEVKACAMPEDCIEGSINLGKIKSVQMTSCCTTKLCNNKFPDYKSTPNGKKCFSCEGEDCTQTVNCQGEENHCMKLTANAAGVSATMKGCASNLMYSARSFEVEVWNPGFVCRSRGLFYSLVS
ncbi:PREDICTED: urokinase plasminogen activator surface receptor-like [Cyprinodon variegatus]|uniref:urokinase plasminogen activator surface receptor-like n=1 Tax=Cyprinodon variegatus TaxID=28743 RepID=UPI0007427EAB|nr:PREDICTED: urokinase plasminogen activator surface receptor-like [Cyprinodon variegatus]